MILGLPVQIRFKGFFATDEQQLDYYFLKPCHISCKFSADAMHEIVIAWKFMCRLWKESLKT